MIAISSTLAEKMALISVLIRENSSETKKKLLQLCSEIQEDSKFIAGEAKKIADACKDKSLKLQVLQSLESIPTLSTQLKIIAAVKATEGSKRESEKTLVLCCQNLMKSIETALKSSEVASIRVLRSGGDGSNTVLKFRKLVYAKASNGQPINLSNSFKIISIKDPSQSQVKYN
jgi:vinculin